MGRALLVFIGVCAALLVTFGAMGIISGECAYLGHGGKIVVIQNQTLETLTFWVEAPEREVEFIANVGPESDYETIWLPRRWGITQIKVFARKGDMVVFEEVYYWMDGDETHVNVNSLRPESLDR
jgi:hypothetical protein